MTINIDDFDQVKLHIEQLKKAVKDNKFEGIQFYHLDILTNNDEKQTIQATKFFITIIDKHPAIIPHLLEYVKSIETVIIPEEYIPPLGLIPMAALAITDTKYLKHFETFLKMILEKGKDIPEMIISDDFDALISVKDWDENTMKFIAYCIYELKSDYSLCFPKKIKPKLVDVFLKSLYKRAGKKAFLNALRLDDYDFEFLFMDLIGDDDLLDKFRDCIEKGNVPTYAALIKAHTYVDWDDPDYVAEQMQAVANRAKTNKAAIQDFIEFINEADFNHPTGEQVEAEIMEEVIAAWDWCPETIDLAVTCFFTPAQWGPDECIPMRKTMSPEMFDLFMKKMCDEAFSFANGSKSYNENYEVKEDYVERNFRFGFVMEMIANHFDKDEAHLRTELNKAIAQKCYPTYQFFETGKM